MPIPMFMSMFMCLYLDPGARAIYGSSSTVVSEMERVPSPGATRVDRKCGTFGCYAAGPLFLLFPIGLLAVVLHHLVHHHLHHRHVMLHRLHTLFH